MTDLRQGLPLPNPIGVFEMTYVVNAVETWEVVVRYQVEADTPEEAKKAYRESKAELMSQEVVGSDMDDDPQVG
jgi:hypothetical protein